MLIAPSDSRLLWLLLRTKPKQERVVVDCLQGRGFEAYYPRVLEPRRHARAPHGPVPLFPAYVFAHCVLREDFQQVQFCPGAAGVVRFGDEFAAVEDDMVATLKEREGDRGFLEVKEVRQAPQRGSKVRVVEGALEGLEGIVTRYLPARDRVRLLLTMVSGVRSVEVEARNVRCA
jgi:transcription antitermination factor NusG